MSQEAGLDFDQEEFLPEDTLNQEKKKLKVVKKKLQSEKQKQEQGLKKFNTFFSPEDIENIN